jgi:signal transduction histidine kinase
MKRSLPVRHRALLASLLTAILLLPLWGLGLRWYKDQLLIGVRAQMAEQIGLQATALSAAINRRFALVQGLHAFVQAQPTALELNARFDKFAAGLYNNVDVGVIRNITVAPGGVVGYVYPLEGNEPLLRYAYFQDPRPDVRAELDRTLHTRRTILSAPTQLIEGGVGLVARQALYQGDEFWGLVSITLNVTPFFAEAGMLDPNANLSLALRDGEGRIFIGLPELFDRQPVISQIDLPEGSWQLAGVPTRGWPALMAAPLRLFGAVGLLIVALLSGLVYLSINRQVRLALAAQHEERQRIARELHDSVSQALYGIGLGARTAREALIDEDREGAAESVDYVLSLAEAGLAEMRALLLELRPEALEQDGLTAALTKQAAALGARYQINVRSDLGAEPDLAAEAKQALYRIGQEALHNIAKHAHARHVDLHLGQTAAGIVLEVRDDGVGFDPSGAFPGHLGLRSMRERIESLGGSLHIDSVPGQGTTIRAEIP